MICHQINWDFLRKTVLDYTIEYPDWIKPENMRKIRSQNISSLLAAYNKPERIRAEERAKMLRSLGQVLCNFEYKYSDMFFDCNGEVRDKESIFAIFKSSMAFVNDPEEKKNTITSTKSFGLPRTVFIIKLL
jgi:hypothetical protein